MTDRQSSVTTSHAAERPPRVRRRGVDGALLGVAAVICLAAAGVRLVGLSRQSYWVDELFSVTQSSGSLANLWHMGLTEVHPPTFALGAWVWEHLGHSLRPGWMRLFPALFGAAVPVVTHRTLRHLPLDRLARSVMVTGTSVCGLGLVYAQDMRSYSLLFLTAIGVTASSLRLVCCPDERRAALRQWTLWSFAAGAVHLFGGLLAGACALLLLCPWSRQPIKRRRQAWALAIAELPQVLWIVPGAFTPGFSRGAGWIDAPGASDVALLVTSVFGVCRLSLASDGFPLAAPWGVVALAGVALLGLALRRPTRGHAPGVPAPHPTLGTTTWSDTATPPLAGAPSRKLLCFLTALVVGFTLALFLVSQLLHLWTLRNMIVLAPALVWLAMLAILRLARSGVQRRVLAAALLLCSLAQLVGTTRAMQAPYKSQFGPAMQRAAQLRARYPALQVHQSGTSAQWLYSTSLPATDAEYHAIMGASTDVGDPATVPAAPVGVPTLYIVYTSTHAPSAPVDAELLRHNRAGCHAEPFVSVAFVVCVP